MFEKINHWFATTLKIGVQEDQQQHSAQLAAAILLLEVSRADFDISEQEQHVILNVLAEQFDLSAQEAASIFNYARQEHEEYTSSHPFIRLLNDTLDGDEKRLLLKGLWRVAYADKRLDKYEEYHIRKIADWLYLSHADFIRTRHKVMQALGIDE